MNLRKKCIALALTAVMLLFAGCGTGNDTSSASAEKESQPQALDLVGSWEQQDGGDDYHLAGFIKDDLIELHWVSSYDQNGSVYWAGTYVAPKDMTEPYTWESERNDAILQTSAYGCVDATRTFTYQDGVLTMAASDTSYEVVLLPADSDFTYLAVEVPEPTEEEKAAAEAEEAAQQAADNAAAAAEEEVEDVNLKESGYAVQFIGGGKSLVYYSAQLNNPNQYNAISDPVIEITVRDADGKLLTKQHKTIGGIAPGDRLEIGDSISCPQGEPAEVEITAKNTDYAFSAFEGSGVFSTKDLKVGDIAEERADGSTSFSGKVTNNAETDVNGVAVSVVYAKDGKNIGGVTTSIGTIAAGESAEFSVADNSGFSDYDSYEVRVFQAE